MGKNIRYFDLLKTTKPTNKIGKNWNYPVKTKLDLKSAKVSKEEDLVITNLSKLSVVNIPVVHKDEEKSYRQLYLQLLNRQLTLLKDLKKTTAQQPSSTHYPENSIALSTFKSRQSRFNFLSFISFWIIAFFVPIVVFWGFFETSVVYGQDLQLNYQQVAGVRENLEVFFFDQTEYNTWIKQKTGLILSTEGDLDDDGLANLEEFLLGTDPTNTHTCNSEKNDLENILQLIDPLTCEKIEIENSEGLSRFNHVVHIPTLAHKLFGFVTEQETSSVKTSNSLSLYEIFEVENLSEINVNGQNNLQQEIELLKKRDEYLKIIRKIDEYITKYRSYEKYDINYATPVSAAVFLETSIRYDVPLKYVLTVARLESRFGTDRYTSNGNLTRPGAHQNMFSIGLDDSGNNLTYSSWEEGVYAFGRWYRYFDDRGVSDCQKWRIYNPNGDYCAKVEQVAAEAQAFIFGG